MAFSLPGVPFKLSPEDMGMPDLTTAIANGLKLGYLPKELPAELALKEADARSKNAYANLMLPQAILKVLSNKEAAEALPVPVHEKFQRLAGTLADYQMNNNQNKQTSESSPLENNIYNYNNPDSGYSYNQNGTNKVASDQEINETANKYSEDKSTPAERMAAYEQTVAAGKGYGQESGKIRANEIKDMDTQVYGSTDLLSTLGEANKIVASPIMSTIRDNPAMGKYQIAYLSKFGSPEQQKTIGNLKNIMGNIVVDFASRFKGTFRRGEQGLVSEMKINDADTINGMVGKLESMNYLVQLGHDRNQLAAKLMRNDPRLDRNTALERSQKMINGDAIKAKINAQLHPNSILNEAAAKGYTEKMTRINPKTNMKETALVHPDDVEAAKQEGWSNE